MTIMYTSVPSPSYPSTPPTLNNHLTLGRNRASPSPAASASTSPPASPTSPVRPGRLRGLSYLRNYTHNHLLSRESHGGSSRHRPSISRATSYPTPTSSTSTTTTTTTTTSTNTSTSSNSPAAASASPSIHQRPTISAQQSTTDLPIERSSNPEITTSTSGWVPTVGGHSGVSSTRAEPQSTPTSTVLSVRNPSETLNLPAPMARTRSGNSAGAADMSHPPVESGRAGTNSRNDTFAQLTFGGRPRLRSTSQNTGHSQVEATRTATTPQNDTQTPAATGRNAASQIDDLPSIRFTAYQDPRAQRPSLTFSPMGRILPTGKEIIKVGRFSERDNQPSNTGNVPSSAPIGFKSKVVSRRHCEFWCTGGRWFIKDVKSSSGTFLNHVRLSSPGVESRPFPVNDGDIVQLGIDFKGGEEMIFRCVKIRVELNKGAHPVPSSFSVQSHKRLRELNSQGNQAPGGSSQDCSICLGPIAPCQSLFVAPCSHTWHYKCIRVIINGPHWPQFMCPNCRTVADLEEEFDYPTAAADEEWEQFDPEDPIQEHPESPTPSSHLRPQTSASLSRAEIETQAGDITDLSAHAEQISLVEPAETPVPAFFQGVDVFPNRSSLEISRPDNAEPIEVSDDSDDLPQFSDTVEAMGDLRINNEAHSPISSVSSNAHEISNATVSPVDIVKKPAANLGGASSQFERTPSRRERSDRSPSPHLLPSWSPEGFLTGEGPMTPRNDIGPFVFDGSGGRVRRSSDHPQVEFSHPQQTPVANAAL